MGAAPINLVHIALAHLDRTMLTSPDGKRVEVNLEAIARLVANPPAMLRRPTTPPQEQRYDD